MTGPVVTVTSAFDEQLDRRRIDVIRDFSRTLRWPVTATALVISFLVWGPVAPGLVATWFVAAVAVREWRALRVEALARGDLPSHEKLRRIAWWDVPIGISHGSAALFMIRLDVTRDALLTMILVSLAAGAVSTSAVHLRLYVTYAVCVFVPTCALWLLEATPLAFGVAALIVMFAAVQFRFAKENALVFEQSFRIRLENEALVQDLAKARDIAETANQAKSRFLAAASHDLRQPLHALMLHSGALMQDPLPSDAPAIAAELSASINSLGQLLDSLLDISKLDAGVMSVNRRPIKLQRLVAHVVGGHRASALEKGITLQAECADDAVVVTDPLLLERLLRNLVDNAVKYTERGDVRVVAEADGDGIALSVRDSGCGIPAEAREKVFEEFYQLGNAGRDRMLGLGLGLAIVRRVSVLLEMPVTLASEVGVGTVVTLRLSRSLIAASELASHVPALASPSVAGLNGVRVLVIDDEESVRRAMRIALRRFGSTSVEAASVDEALDLARSFVPQLVLADYRLANANSGIDAIARLRAVFPGLPALLISGDTDSDRLIDAQRSGLTLLHKPVSIERLRDAMLQELAGAAQAVEGNAA